MKIVNSRKPALACALRENSGLAIKQVSGGGQVGRRLYFLTPPTLPTRISIFFMATIPTLGHDELAAKSAVDLLTELTALD